MVDEFAEVSNQIFNVCYNLMIMYVINLWKTNMITSYNNCTIQTDKGWEFWNYI